MSNLSEGMKYKHRQITDVTYKIVAIDNEKGKVILQDDTRDGSLVSVTFAQLQVNYKKA